VDGGEEDEIPPYNPTEIAAALHASQRREERLCDHLNEYTLLTACLKCDNMGIGVKVMTPRAKITVDLGDDELYQAIKIAAIEHRASLREVVIEALRDWLRHQEELEDLRDYQEAKGEPARPFKEFLAELTE